MVLIRQLVLYEKLKRWPKGQAQKVPIEAELAKIDEFSITADEEDWMELVAYQVSLGNKTIYTILADWLASAPEAQLERVVSQKIFRIVPPFLGFGEL